MVEEHIRHLLHDHDCVIIPDFGGLITHYASARIHPVKHTFVPPSRRIALNEKLQVNDGLLISTISRQDQVPVETAREKVADFVLEMKAVLQAKYKFEMQGIGLFRLNADQKIEFEYIPADNLLGESFGLPELVARPVVAAPPVKMRNLFQDQPLAPSVAGKKKTARARLTRFYRVAAAVVIGSLTFSGLYYLSSQSDSTLSSLNPFPPFLLAEQTLPETAGAAATPSSSSPFEYQKSKEEIVEMYREFYPAGLADQLLSSKYAEEAVAGISDWDEYVNSLEEVPAPEDSASSLEAPEPEAEAPADTRGEPEKSIEKVEVGEEAKAPKSAAPTDAPAEGPKTVRAAAAAGAKAPATVIPSPTGRFYIIIGGFSDLESASKSQKVLQKQGRKAKILLPNKGSKLHRLAVADFSNREAAVKVIEEMRAAYGSGSWILHY
ncbi:hypothetical protein BH24BAC1_BH24BAC1_01020 [soil metagenome]